MAGQNQDAACMLLNLPYPFPTNQKINTHSPSWWCRELCSLTYLCHRSLDLRGTSNSSTANPAAEQRPSDSLSWEFKIKDTLIAAGQIVLRTKSLTSYRMGPESTPKQPWVTCKPEFQGSLRKEAGVEKNKDMQRVAKVRDHAIPEGKENAESRYLTVFQFLRGPVVIPSIWFSEISCILII